MGTENDAHENERFNPASRLCPSRVSLPSVLPHGCKERQTPTRGSSPQDGRLLVLAARVRSDSDLSPQGTRVPGQVAGGPSILRTRRRPVRPADLAAAPNARLVSAAVW